MLSRVCRYYILLLRNIDQALLRYVNRKQRFLRGPPFYHQQVLQLRAVTLPVRLEEAVSGQIPMHAMVRKMATTRLVRAVPSTTRVLEVSTGQTGLVQRRSKED
jgi:hypothetical protein